LRQINFIVVHSDKCDSECHFEVKKDGSIVEHSPIDKEVKHCNGLNKTSLSIRVVDPSDESITQNKALKRLCKKLIKTCNISKMDIVAHDALDDEVLCLCLNLYECI
jgi:N-acetyl-anhydromuramyl-L-alanine amidase AmpD